MSNKTAHLALYDGAAEMEVGHLLAELHTGRFTGSRFDVVTIAESREPITTMGGVRIVPDAQLANLVPSHSELLILPGSEMWDTGGGEAFAAAAGYFLEAGVPVAAICGGTAGLARAGLLDQRDHTSAAPEYLAATGYAGGDRYRNERAVIDGDLITAGPQSPVQFARATLQRLNLASERTLDLYEALFDRGDLTAFPELMQPRAPRERMQRTTPSRPEGARVGAIHVHEFMSFDGVIDAPKWTFEYGFTPQMEETISAPTVGVTSPMSSIAGCRQIS